MPSSQGGSHARHRRPSQRARERKVWEGKVERRLRARKRHRHRHRNRRIRVALITLGALGAVALVYGLLLYRDLTGVRDDLTAARTSLQQAVADPNALRTDEGRAATGARVEAAAALVAKAREAAVQSVPLTASKWLPGLKSQRTGLVTLVDDAAVATNAGRDLLRKLAGVTARTRLVDGKVPLDGLTAFGGDLRTASQSVGGLVRGPGGLWGPLRDARQEFDSVATSTATRLADAADAVDATVPFMGASGDRRYFVAIQNNAEMRDQGMVLSYAIVRFQAGVLTFERNGSVADLALTGPAPIEIPPGTAEVFGSTNPTTIWQSVNGTADFSWSARAMWTMYRAATNQQVDGVIAIDVVGLQLLMGAVGSVTVPGIAEPVGVENAPRILLSDLYEGLPPGSPQGPRRELLSDVTRAVVTRLTSGDRDSVAIGRALGNAAEGGHLKLWSEAPAEESVFLRTGLGGGPAAIAPDRTFHVAVENRTATKLDYYVTTSLKVDVTLRKSGDAVVRTTVTIENKAPKDAKPSYAFGPDQFMTGPGDYRAWVLLWGPAGSQSGATTVEESGLRLAQYILPVGPGERKDVVFPDTVIPKAVRDGELQLRFVPQPRLEASPLQLTLTASGRRLKSPAAWTGKLDKVVAHTWRLG